MDASSALDGKMGLNLKKPWSLSNGTTNAIRLYLRDLTVKYFKFSREETKEEISKIIMGDPSSKWLAHNLLFLHLNISEIESLKSNLTYFALANLDWNPIDPELYIDLVFLCHLHEYFLVMITASRQLPFSRHFLSLVAQRVLTTSPEIGNEIDQRQQKQEELTKEEWLLYLSLLSWLNRASDSDDQFYPHIHQKFLNEFLDLPESKLPTITKIEVLVQLSGIACLTREDYHGNTEICDSLIELNFDPMISMNETGVSEFFHEMFRTLQGSDTVSVLDAPINYHLIKRIGDAIVGLKFEKGSEICKILEGERVRISRRMGKILSYIGDYSYLTNLIIKKNVLSLAVHSDSPANKDLDPPSAIASKILEVTNFLEKFKSKSRCEDYDFRFMKFDEFCELLRSKSSDKYRHVQSSWHDKFLSFEEAFTTPEGCSLAELYIAPNVSFDIGMKMLKKILKMTVQSPESITDEIKMIVLILVFNKNLYCEFEQVVDLIFKSKRLHNKFCTNAFQSQLNELNLKLGVKGYFDTNTNSLAQSLIHECRRLTLQNPVVAAQNILSRSLQLSNASGGSQVLQSLRQFWDLNVPTSDPANELNGSSPGYSENRNLLEHCLSQLVLTVTNELTRNVHSKSQLKNFIPIFLNDSFITALKFEEILISIVLDLIGKKSNDNVVAVLDIYQDLVSTVLDQQRKPHACNVNDFLQLVYLHMEGIREGTYVSTTIMDSNSLRDKAIQILNLLLEFNETLLLRPIEATSNNFRVLVDLPLTSLVLLYARTPAWRNCIHTYIKSSPEFLENGGDLGISTMEEVIRNSSPMEWKDVMDMLYEICYRSLEGDELQSFDKWMRVMCKVLLFEVARKDETVSEFADDTRKKRGTLEQQQMKSPSLLFQRFGEHLVKVVTGSGSESGSGCAVVIGSSYRSVLSKYPSLQLELIKSFVAVASHFPDEPQYFSAKQSTLMSLLDLATWIVTINTVSGKNKNYVRNSNVVRMDSLDFLEQCFIIVKTLKKTPQGKLAPICKCIIDVLRVAKNHGNKKKIASIIPIGDVTEKGKESDVHIRLREMNEDALRSNTNSDGLPLENYCKMKILNLSPSD